MCGLVGLAGNLEFKDESTFRKLLIFDYFRGMDSTGAAVLRNNGDTHLVKLASHPIDLFDSTRFKTAVSGSASKVFLGHNRAATLGKVNGLNAHPFQYGHILGAHNGTLDRESWQRLEEAIGFTTDVDSAAIFAAISKIGIEETVSLLEEGVTSQKGAWALTWFNTEDNTLNFLRNRHRPFWTAFTKDFKKIFWASEWPMISAATRMSATAYEMYADDKGHGFWETEVDTWYKFDLDELRKGSVEFPDARHKELKGREPKPAVSYTGGGAPFTAGNPHGTQTTRAGGKNWMTTPGEESTNSSCPDKIELVGGKFTPWGGFIDKYDFDQFARYGCSTCDEEVAYEDVGSILFAQTNQVMCPKCTGSSDVNRIYASPEEMKEFIRTMNDGPDEVEGRGVSCG